MISYKFSFPQFELFNFIVDGKEKVISGIQYQLIATDADNPTVYALEGDMLEVEYTSGQEFIIFENLTFPIVEQWVTDKLGAEKIARIKQLLDTRIEAQLNPPKIYVTGNWLRSPV